MEIVGGCNGCQASGATLKKTSGASQAYDAAAISAFPITSATITHRSGQLHVIRLCLTSDTTDNQECSNGFVFQFNSGEHLLTKCLSGAYEESWSMATTDSFTASLSSGTFTLTRNGGSMPSTMSSTI